MLALTLGAMIQAAGSGASTVGRLRNQTLAAWVAENRLNEALLERDWPEEGSERGMAEMAGRQWQWQLRVINTEDEDLRRLEVEVRLDPDDQAADARLVGFKGRP